MSEKIVVSSSGSSIAGLLGVVFITLKLTGVISWSWLWVLAPFWIPFIVTLGLIGLWLFVKFLLAFLRRWEEIQTRK